MKETILLVGGGGHCKACIDVIEQAGKFQIIGIIDFIDKLHQLVLGHSVIGCDEVVRAIRNIEKALGDGIKKPSPSEYKNKPIARKSIVAARSIRRGETFTVENLMIKRPGTGISPMCWDDILKMKASKDFYEDEIICL